MMVSKTDINPATGKAYAINPQTNVWDDNYWANTVEPQLKAQSPETSSIMPSTQATIDLPKIYEGLYAQSGITDAEKQLIQKQNESNAAIAKIKDNPYLSEATMTGRISKLTDKSNADIGSLKNDIAMKKADIETKLNLQTKQFDINSEVAKQSLDKFQALLGSGALANASGEDIANLTRSTGLSSSMIQSAIKAQQDKNVTTRTIPFDDGTNQGYVIINEKTGEVINKQIIAASAPTAIEQKAALGTGGTVSTTKQIAADKAAAPAALTEDVKVNRMTLGTAMALYQQYGLTKQKIYDIYKANTAYNWEANVVADQTRYGVK